MMLRYKSAIALVLVTLFLAPLFSMPTTMNATSEPNAVPMIAPAQAGPRVLFDEAHCAGGSELMTPGNTSLLAWMLEEHGYEAEINFDEEIDSTILTDIDVLALFFPMVALTTAEVNAITDFVNAGGGLLLVGTDDSTSWGFDSANLNDLSETFGITFNLDSWLGTSITLDTHHLTQDVSSIHVNLDYKLRACSLTLSSPAVAIAEGGDNDLVAISEYGSGKVVAVSAAAPFIMYRHLLTWQTEKDDLFQFSLNIFDWLTGHAPRKVSAGETAIITVGSGPNLSESVLETYSGYSGLIHDHTTHSDGQGTVEEMVWAGQMAGFDFMAISDHSYDEPVASGREGITGALAARDYCNEYGIPIEQFIAAELSHGHHSLGLPMTANVYATTQEEMVTGVHNQGGIIALCHPTIGAQYMPTYVQMESYGYDAIEVDNSGFIHGILEEGYNWPFYGASDGHSPDFVGKVVNIAFVNETTGPDGRLADWDVVNAILDKRIVIVDHVADFIYGQKVWVDLYLEMMAEVEAEIANAQAAVDASTAEGGTTLAEWYLREAKAVFAIGCPMKAMGGAIAAQTATALNLRFEAVLPDPQTLEPNEAFMLSLNISNYGPDPIEFNSTLYRRIGISSVDVVAEVQAIPAEGWLFLNRSITANDVGILMLPFILRDFNISDLPPILFVFDALVDAGSSATYEQTTEGTLVTPTTAIERGDFRFIDRALLFYNDGSGWQNITASIRTVTLEGEIGPYPKDTVIDYYFMVYGEFGGLFVLDGGSYTVVTDPLETTTSTSTTTNGTTPLDPVLLAAAVGGTVLAIVVIVLIGKRRNG